jgi:uncharacterized protein
VDYRRQFLISFGGLKLGHHYFDFEIDDRFFEEFEYSDYSKGALSVKIEMEKMERMLVFNFLISGSVEVICDRCLDAFQLMIECQNKLFVKFGAENLEESDDVIVIPQNEIRFDVMHYIYEYITLSVPIRHVHPDDGLSGTACDPVVLKKLEELKPTETSDPRWDALRKLKQ